MEPSEQKKCVKSVKKKWRAGVLGATGIVGQRLVKLLAGHPWFELTEVAASERSSGKPYAEAVRWHLETPIPEVARDLVVKGVEPVLECDFVFSALDSSVAGPVEVDFARAGYPVVSNSKNHRMDADVPLRAVPDPANQLTAGSVDVLATRLADRRHEAGVDQHLLEREDPRAWAGPYPRCQGWSARSRNSPRRCC